MADELSRQLDEGFGHAWLRSIGIMRTERLGEERLAGGEAVARDGQTAALYGRLSRPPRTA